METKFHLDEATIDELQTLIQINLDSQEAFTELAENVKGDPLASYFTKLSQDRATQAAELQSLVADNAEEPSKDGTMTGAAKRAWTNLRAALGGGRHTMLCEAESEEDRIKHAYEDALKREPGTAVSDVLHRHMANVKAAHDRVRELRDREK
ncbi:PA2169 family four-helix-bundle protein [Lignipirellula cremea]|uniref:DUF2383 domain-containing protein n=1 Tax=Lignipirellula cremea TaxID=2528010 RepID=A0A518E083_9BACT|nr:PA2169 family four-helix-bundle protein [Lignipirellula cremea]QDU97493.1 hypothetical protein Pla8534_53410 [Lignipirellula cremea]